MTTNHKLANRLLTYSFVIFLFCIGFDKIIQTNLITNWQLIVGPVVHFLIPLTLGSVVMIEGAVEILLGVLLLTRWKTYSLGLLILTIVIVIIDLFILRYYNLAIHESMFVVVCVAIYFLGETKIKQNFTNELGNAITIRVSEQTIEDVSGVLISIVGPDSETSNHITKVEAQVLHEQLGQLFKE